MTLRKETSELPALCTASSLPHIVMSDPGTPCKEHGRFRHTPVDSTRHSDEPPYNCTHS